MGYTFEEYEAAIKNLKPETSQLDNFYSKYYVDRGQCYRNKDLVTNLEIKRDENQKILFWGHRGSGKTTELLNIKEILKKNDKLIVFFIQSVHDGLSKEDISYIDILVAIFVKIFKDIPKNFFIEDNLMEEIKTILERLGGNLENTKDNASERVEQIGHSFWKILQQKKEDENENVKNNASNLTGDLKSIFNKIISQIEKREGKKILIIVDDLEKVTSLDTIESLFVDNYYLIDSICCNFIFTIPLSLRYSRKFETTRRTYTTEYTLPLFEIRQETGELNLMEIEKMSKIITNRIPLFMIDKTSLHTAIVYSGGVIADLLRLISDAIVKAVSQNRNISSHVILESFTEERINVTRPMDAKDKQILKEIQNSKRPILDKLLWVDLLYSLHVLEYRNTIDGELWYDVHPFSSPDITKLERVVATIK